MAGCPPAWRFAQVPGWHQARGTAAGQRSLIYRFQSLSEAGAAGPTRPDARVRRRLWQVRGGYQIRKYRDLGINRHTGTGVRAKSFFTTKTFQPVTSKYFTGS